MSDDRISDEIKSLEREIDNLERGLWELFKEERNPGVTGFLKNVWSDDYKNSLETRRRNLEKRISQANAEIRELKKQLSSNIWEKN